MKYTVVTARTEIRMAAAIILVTVLTGNARIVIGRFWVARSFDACGHADLCDER